MSLRSWFSLEYKRERERERSNCIANERFKVVYEINWDFLIMKIKDEFV